MSWKHKLNRKIPTLLLLCSLILTCAFSVYALTYRVFRQNFLGPGAMQMQLSAGSSVRFQLDSQTFMWVTANTQFFSGDCMLDWTNTTGEFWFYPTVSTSLKVWWQGNVSNVKFDSSPIANYTNQVGDPPTLHMITWNWQGYDIVPPPSQYSLGVFSYNVNTSSAFTGLPFTMTTDGIYVQNLQTTFIQNPALDAGHIYQFDFPETYPYNESLEYQFSTVEIWANGVFQINWTTTSFSGPASADATVIARYILVPIGLPQDVSNLMTFGIGIMGFLMMGAAPFVGYYYYKREEYEYAFFFSFVLAIFGYGFLFVIFGG